MTNYSTGKRLKKKLNKHDTVAVRSYVFFLSFSSARCFLAEAQKSRYFLALLEICQVVVHYYSCSIIRNYLAFSIVIKYTISLDTVPEMQHYFVEQAVQPGVQVSLICSGTGSPPPQFKWLLDGQSLIDLKPDYR